jgi:hypothetical protein
MGIGGSLIKVKNNTKLVWTLNPAYSSIYSSLVSLLSNKPFDFSYKVDLIPNAATYSEFVLYTADFLDPFLLQQRVRTNSCFLFLLIIAATTTNPWDIIHAFAWYFPSPSHSSILPLILEQVKGLLPISKEKGMCCPCTTLFA